MKRLENCNHCSVELINEEMSFFDGKWYCSECLERLRYVSTDKLSVEKLQEELEGCIQTLIEASVAATIAQDIVVGNLVDRKLADLAKTHKLAVAYIEKVTGKNIDVVLAENAALEAEEEE